MTFNECGVLEEKFDDRKVPITFQHQTVAFLANELVFLSSLHVFKITQFVSNFAGNLFVRMPKYKCVK